MVEIQISGIDSLLTKLTSAQGRNKLRAPMDKSVKLIERRMKKYPPPPEMQGPARVPVYSFKTKAGATVYIRSNKASGEGISWISARKLRYKRTHRLGNSWTTEVQETGDGLIGKIGNNTEYAPFVQHDPMFPIPHQARVHQGRWQTDAQMMNQEQPTIERYFREAIDKALQGSYYTGT